MERGISTIISVGEGGTVPLQRENRIRGKEKGRHEVVIRERIAETYGQILSLATR